MGHRLVLPVIALAVVAPLAACGADSPSLRAAATGDASLTVATSLSPRADGAMYTEGALTELRLRGPDGQEVGPRRADPGRSIVFHGLAVGRYTVDAALRPCDGTCVNLDPRVDGCRARVRVSGDTVVAVRFVVGRPCAVEPPPRR